MIELVYQVKVIALALYPALWRKGLGAIRLHLVLEEAVGVVDWVHVRPHGGVVNKQSSAHCHRPVLTEQDLHTTEQVELRGESYKHNHALLVEVREREGVESLTKLWSSRVTAPPMYAVLAQNSSRPLVSTLVWKTSMAPPSL